METAALYILITLLAGLSAFQLCLVFGLPLGNFAWGGNHKVLPFKLRVGSCISLVLYALIIFVMTQAHSNNESSIITAAKWIIVGYFALGIPLNALSRSKPERYSMTPVVIILFIVSLILAR